MKGKLIRMFSFMLVLLFSFSVYSSLFNIERFELRQIMETFYKLPRNSVDVLLVSPSTLETFFASPVAFHDYGIAAYGLTASFVPASGYQYLIEEALKTQSPKLIIIDIAAIPLLAEEAGISKVADSVKFFNKNRIDAIDWIVKDLDVSGINYNKYDYYLKIRRYHGAIDLAISNILPYEYFFLGWVCNNQKHGAQIENPMHDMVSAKPKALDYRQKEVLDALLDYCDSIDVPILFTQCPQSYGSIEDKKVADRYSNYTYIREYVSKRGYAVLNAAEFYDDIELDFAKDYYNGAHTNFRGAKKFTQWIARYLKNNYDLPDRRNDKKHKFWNKEYQRLLKYEESNPIE